MAYESRVYIIEDNGSFHEKIASINMSKIPNANSWLSLFTDEINYKLFIYDGDTETDTDCYGERMKEAPIEKVIEWIEKEMPNSDYRRLSVLYSLLKGFNPEQWNAIKVVHYGY